MMKHTHTPGPWVAKGRFVELAEPPTDNRAVWNGPVLQVYTRGLDEDQAEANARLISAAPEMLAALEAAVDYWKDTTVASRTDTKAYAILVQMRTALEKARGT